MTAARAGYNPRAVPEQPVQPGERPQALAPRSPLRGALRAPGSKSLAQRALVIAGLAQGETRIAGLPGGDDVRAALDVLRAAGVEVREFAPAAVGVRGAPPGPHRGWRAVHAFELGESGTLARFALAVTGLCGRVEDQFELRAAGSLLRRRSDALFDALRVAGVRLDCPAGPHWPVRVGPIGPPPTVRLERPRSSQEASALAIALAAWPDESVLEIAGELPSKPYFQMTRRVLAQFGARVSGASGELSIRGPLRAPDEPLTIEPDASLAAVALAAACLSGGEVLASGLSVSSLQGDVRIAEHLRAFGCRARFDPRGLSASGFPQRAAELDLRGEPDLAPVLAAVAAGAALVDPQGESVLRGLESLPDKESSRIEVLAQGLSSAGWSVTAGPDSLRIRAGSYRGGRSEPAELELDPHGDHRMAFSFALLGLLRPHTFVRGPGCVAKSWPGFWHDLSALGPALVK